MLLRSTRARAQHRPACAWRGRQAVRRNLYVGLECTSYSDSSAHISNIPNRLQEGSQLTTLPNLKSLRFLTTDRLQRHLLGDSAAPHGSPTPRSPKILGKHLPHHQAPNNSDSLPLNLDFRFYKMLSRFKGGAAGARRGRVRIIVRSRFEWSLSFRTKIARKIDKAYGAGRDAASSSNAATYAIKKTKKKEKRRPVRN